MSATEIPAEAKGGKKKFAILLVVLALSAGGFYYFLGASAKSDEKAKPEPGEVLVLEPVHVNLSGGGYLKIGIALQLTADAGAHGEPAAAPALDLVISEFSQATLSEVTHKRAQMKHDLEEKIIEAYHHDVIQVYLTEYVTQ